jgi:hypothetical protein
MSYQEIADRYGVELCTDCALNVHERGHVEPGRGRIHWQERRRTRGGLRRFLLLVAAVVLHRDGEDGGSQAEWIWATNSWAYHAARSMGVQFSRALSADDRARVRYLLRGKARSRAKEWAHHG